MAKSGFKGLHKGAFTAKAKAAGESVAEYAQQEKNAPGLTGKQARLAQVFEGFARRRKRAKRA